VLLKACWNSHRVSPAFARAGWEPFIPSQLPALGGGMPMQQGQGKLDMYIYEKYIIACLLPRNVSLNYTKL